MKLFKNILKMLFSKEKIKIDPEISFIDVWNNAESVKDAIKTIKSKGL